MKCLYAELSADSRVIIAGSIGSMANHDEITIDLGLRAYKLNKRCYHFGPLREYAEQGVVLVG